jgi:serine/threonine-protein kinase
MGSVYAVQHLRTGGRCAVKVLRRDATADGTLYRRFQHEARIAAELNHPHIVQVIDFNEDEDGTPFLVMELLEGEDLEARLRRTGRLPLDQAVELARQVGSALQAAHEKGVVHRDIKPSNIFLARCGLNGRPGEIAKVVDFGICKIRHAASRLTGDQSLLGTPDYMSPEAAAGERAEVDERSDQWALAVILYRALSGRLPFEGDSGIGVLYKVVHHRPAPLRKLAPQVPRPVARVIERALSKRREDRFASMAHFVAALTGSSSPSRVRRHVLAGAAAAAALALATALHLWPAQGTSPGPLAVSAPALPPPDPVSAVPVAAGPRQVQPAPTPSAAGPPRGPVQGPGAGQERPRLKSARGVRRDGPPDEKKIW